MNSPRIGKIPLDPLEWVFFSTSLIVVCYVLPIFSTKSEIFCLFACMIYGLFLVLAAALQWQYWKGGRVGMEEMFWEHLTWGQTRQHQNDRPFNGGWCGSSCIPMRLNFTLFKNWIWIRTAIGRQNILWKFLAFLL